MPTQLSIYLVRRTDDWDYDEFSELVVVAETAYKATRTTNFLTPSGHGHGKVLSEHNWPVRLTELEVTLLGVAASDSKPGIILGNFHAG